MWWEEERGWTTDKRPIIEYVWLKDEHEFREWLRRITRGDRFDDTDGVVAEGVRSNGRLEITVPCTKGSDGRWGLRSEAAARKLEAIVGACAVHEDVVFYSPEGERGNSDGWQENGGYVLGGRFGNFTGEEKGIDPKIL